MSAAVDPVALATEITRARAAGRTLPVAFSAGTRPLTLDEAYAVQREVTAARLARGERVVGWKLGYTSTAMRHQMGIDAPNYGPLTDVMLLTSGAALPGGELQPRVEPEIGLRLGRRPVDGAGVEEVLDACDSAFACLEVVDSVWEGYRFTIEDNTADGSSAAWLAVGPELPIDDLPAIAVTLSVDGAAVADATGAAAGGHPAAAVAWLAGQLSRRGLALDPGDIVITGGLTAAVALRPGGTVTASFTHPKQAPRPVSVAVRRARR